MTEYINLHNIKAPNLNSATYGADIRQQFENINDNFRKLSNYDFIKGEDGKSVTPTNIDLSLSENTQWVDVLKNTIYNYNKGIGSDSVFLNDIEYKWDDNFSKNPGELLLMYTGDKIVSSLPYIYIDPRFNEDLLKRAEQNDYSQLIDYTCVVYFDKYENDQPVFRVVELFPTLYFDNDQQKFCWKIWGNETGLIASGPQGKDGVNGNILVVSRNYSERPNLAMSSVFKIRSILINGEFTSIDKIDNISQYNGFPAVVYYDNMDLSDPDKNKYWISNIIVDNNIPTVICSDYNKVENKFSNIELFNTMLDINPYSLGSNDVYYAKGLFLPIGYQIGEDPHNQPAHILYNEGTREQDKETNSNRKTLVLSSVSNIGEACSSSKYPGVPGLTWPLPVSNALFKILMNTIIDSNFEVKRENSGIYFDDDGLKIKLENKWYLLSVDDNGFMKCSLTTEPLHNI